MKNVQLVRLDPAIEESLANDPAYMDAMINDDWPRVAAIVQKLVGRKLTTEPVSIDKLEWGGYFVVDTATREVIGSCAFKGPPTDEGTVEIAYFTYPVFEGKGYATAMAHKLVELTACSTAVNRVLAHTLPHENASTRVLEKIGMTFVGEVIDPADGRVWQWQAAVKG